MNFNKNEIGEELKDLLIKGYDTKQISDWADRLVGTKILSTVTYNIMNRLAIMEAGPEFEYTIEELRKISELLISEVDDPFKLIDDMKFKEFSDDK